MDSCTLCRLPLDGPRLTDPRSGAGLHPACFAERLPGDAAVALLSAAALFLLPFVRVWSA
jgi:hypothetical protein